MDNCLSSKVGYLANLLCEARGTTLRFQRRNDIGKSPPGRKVRHPRCSARRRCRGRCARQRSGCAATGPRKGRSRCSRPADASRNLSRLLSNPLFDKISSPQGAAQDLHRRGEPFSLDQGVDRRLRYGQYLTYLRHAEQLHRPLPNLLVCCTRTDAGGPLR
jgi:hypothetical protein